MKKIIRNKNIQILFICISIIIVLLIMIFLVNKIYKLKDQLDNSKVDKIKSVNKYEEDLNIDKAVKIPVIAFHKVVDHETKLKYYSDNEWVNDLDLTNKELEWLYNNGWKTIDLDEFYCWYMNECEFDKKTFVITIDDGDVEAYYNVLPLLDKYDFKATLFVIGNAIPETTSELDSSKYLKLGKDKINELRKEKSRLQIESHSYAEHELDKNGNPIVSTFSMEEMNKDFDNNSEYNFKYYAYPYGYYNNDLLSVISNRKDIKLAFTFGNFNYATRLNNRYEIDRIKISGYTRFDEFKKWFEY